MKDLWEILIPVSKGTSKFSQAHHRQWDEYVRSLAGGLTILHPTKKGYWESTIERMIPVRIACSKKQIVKIAAFTAKHYAQDSIMYYRLSNEVYFYESK